MYISTKTRFLNDLLTILELCRNLVKKNVNKFSNFITFLYFTYLAYNETNNPESNFKRNYVGK